MNWLPAVVTVEPAAEPISLAEARAQCHIDVGLTDFDTELAIYIKSAREYVEKYTGTKLVTQTVALKADRLCTTMTFPIAPVQSVVVTYLDTDGATQTLAADQYELFGAETLEPSIEAAYNVSYPATRVNKAAVTVTAVCGYGDASDVPAPIRQAMLLLIGDWFVSREDVLDRRGSSQEVLPIPNGVHTLLANYRMF